MSVSTEAATRQLPSGAIDEGSEGTLVGLELDGRYRIVRRLGVGGMGAVYEAEHLGLHRHVAVKVLQSNLCTNEKYRKRFLREAKAAGAIASDHIVRTFDFGATEDGLLYFTMEMLEGQDFEQFLKANGRASWEVLDPLFIQIFDALGAAHQRGVIHRDIKPSNCFLCRSSSEIPLVKVLDFGIAKIDGSLTNGEDPIATVETLTATNEMFGTVAYMAPELIEGRPADIRSDIYAVGVMMFRALTGQLPFSGLNAFKVFEKHINAPVPSLRDLAPELSAAVESVVFRAMAKDPDHRYQNIAELSRALIGARAGVIEPSIAALSGQTEAIVRDEVPRTARMTDSIRGGEPISTQVSIDMGPAIAPGHRSSSSRIMLTLVLIAISSGTAVLATKSLGSTSTETAAHHEPERPAEGIAVAPSESPDAGPSDNASPPEPSANTPDASPKRAPSAASATDSPPPAQSVPPRPAITPKKHPRTKAKREPPKKLTLGQRLGAQCPKSKDSRFTIEGMVGSDGKFGAGLEISGGSKAARECMKRYVGSLRLFSSGGSFRHEKVSVTPS